jgi:hypothetical protein
VPINPPGTSDSATTPESRRVSRQTRFSTASIEYATELPPRTSLNPRYEIRLPSTSGGAGICAAIDCRLTRIDELNGADFTREHGLGPGPTLRCGPVDTRPVVGRRQRRNRNAPGFRKRRAS